MSFTKKLRLMKELEERNRERWERWAQEHHELQKQSA